MQTKERSSNIELFRIILMLCIIAHHYVVNSGIAEKIIISPMSPKSIFLLIFGAFGKTGINCFVIVTGYFMCKSDITFKKFSKLVLEVIFYRVTIALIFYFFRYDGLSFEKFLLLLLPVKVINKNFTDAFLVFYLVIPFLNILIKNMNEKEHIALMCICAFTYIALGTIPRFELSFNYVSWFIVLYFISSYIRMYDKEIFRNARVWGLLTIITVLAEVLSVMILASYVTNPNISTFYFFVADSNKPLAVLTAVSAFCFIKNMYLPKNKIINRIASTVFGVLLIHANSDTMRQWLWKDLLNTAGAYDQSYLYWHAIGSVVEVFAICSFIDFVRIQLIEKPFFKIFEIYSCNLFKLYNKFKKNILTKLKMSNNE